MSIDLDCFSAFEPDLTRIHWTTFFIHLFQVAIEFDYIFYFNNYKPQIVKIIYYEKRLFTEINN